MNYNSLKELIKQRRSVRRFRTTAVPSDSILKSILEIALEAPSAGNLQAFYIQVIKDHLKKELLKAAAYDQYFIVEAPIVLVFSANELVSSTHYGKRGKELYSIQDTTIAASYVQLAACACSLDTVWVGAFNEEEVKKILNLADYLRPIILMPLGYGAEKPHRPPRKTFDELVQLSN